MKLQSVGAFRKRRIYALADKPALLAMHLISCCLIIDYSIEPVNARPFFAYDPVCGDLFVPFASPAGKGRSKHRESKGPRQMRMMLLYIETLFL